MIQDVNSVINYFGSIRRRTIHFIQAVPTDKIDWAPQKNEFSCGDIVRHLAATELMFVNAVVLGIWSYSGHSRDLGASLSETASYLEACHLKAITRLEGLSSSKLHMRQPSINGSPVKAWRLLMAMVEHEVHHRSQLAVYLTLMGAVAPQIYGLGIEDVIALTSQPD